MHIRVISQKSKSGNKRQYTQIVRSVRRPDGVPTTVVVAHLGATSPELTENLRQAFAAARKGVRLVSADEQQSASVPGDRLVRIGVSKNLVFLPLADKLDLRSKEECLNRELVLAGVEAIARGENPRLIEQHLKVFLAPKIRPADDK